MKPSVVRASRIDAPVRRLSGATMGTGWSLSFAAPDNVENSRVVVALEETFGPVSPIITFSNIDEAIRISNGTAYGLSSSVCTNRLDYITRFVSELQVGTVNVREVPGYRLELTPFGGIKDSGLGYKEGVLEAMKSFTNTKTYSLPW